MVFKLASKLQEIRQIPQYLFLDVVYNASMSKIRMDILKFKKDKPEENKIDFIVLSPGGSPDDAYRIIRTLRNNFEEVNIIVPFWAKSAATLLSLGGTSIIMDEFGEFGPLDMQIGVERDDSPDPERESALNDEFSLRRIESRAQEMFAQTFSFLYENQKIRINKVELTKQLFDYISKLYKPLLKQINPYSLGKKKRILDIGEQYAQIILRKYNPLMPETVIDYLVDYLVNRCPDHGFIVDYYLMKEIQMPNVFKSEDISDNYANILTDISTLFILNPNHNIFRYVGFIPNILVDETDDETSNDKELVKEVHDDSNKAIENDGGDGNVDNKKE